jgi:hypothetical protein
MAMKKSGDHNIGGEINLGTDNWNVADGYTKLKILRQLILLDRFDTISQFGTEDLGEDQMMSDNDIKRRRVEALQRFHSTLKQLIGNVIFALKKEDQPTVKALQERIKTVSEFISKCYGSKQDGVTYDEIFNIEEDLFDKILDILQDIKDKLNTPLNNANLIFRASEEIDLDKMMDTIVERG